MNIRGPYYTVLLTQFVKKYCKAGLVLSYLPFSGAEKFKFTVVIVDGISIFMQTTEMHLIFRTLVMSSQVDKYDAKRNVMQLFQFVSRMGKYSQKLAD